MSHPVDHFHHGCFPRPARPNCNTTGSDNLGSMHLGFCGHKQGETVLSPFPRSSHLLMGEGALSDTSADTSYHGHTPGPPSPASSGRPIIRSPTNVDEEGSEGEDSLWLRRPINPTSIQRPWDSPSNIDQDLLPSSTAHFCSTSHVTLGAPKPCASPNIPLCSEGHEPTMLRRIPSTFISSGQVKTRGVVECKKGHGVAGGSSEGASQTSTLRRKESNHYAVVEHGWVSSRISKAEPTEAEVNILDGLGDDVFRWAREGRIGEGAYAKVYRARNIATGDIFAVKQVKVPRASSNANETRRISMLQALRRESDMLSGLDHPNIVLYLGLHETQDLCSIFLEYVSGGSLGDCLRRHGKFGEEVTKSFMKQILRGLEYLHSKGILHRDLKSDNILVEPSGICKISDFGISKCIKDIHMVDIHTTMRGTVFWMAPEVINPKKGGYNSKADIWSIGCIVFEMWTGQPPWKDGSERNPFGVLLRMYQSPEAPPLPRGFTLSPLANDFREACFAINPDERLSSSDLQEHPYLVLQQGWTFHGFR